MSLRYVKHARKLCTFIYFSSVNNRCSGIPNKEIYHKLDKTYFRKEFIVISEGYPIVRVPQRNFSYSTKIILRNNDYFVFFVLSIYLLIARRGKVISFCTIRFM